jgi:hypothetical protein
MHAVIWILATLPLMSPAPSVAQYMFLDANGDGANDSRDLLPHHGWSAVDVWLDTSRNRDGAASGMGEGQGGVAAFELTLQVDGIAVEWGVFRPADREMRVTRGPLTDSLAFYIGVECGRPLSAGKHKLGSVHLRPRWGRAELSIVPCRVIGGTASTSFTPRRGGLRLRLGPTVDFGSPPRVVRGEWYDADAVPFSYEPHASAGPVRVDSGIVYLGWNRMRPPYELRVVEGRVAVNGFALPDTARKPGPYLPTNDAKANHRAVAYTLTIARTLHDLGEPDSIAAAGLVATLRLSPYIDSVRVEAGWVHFRYRSSPRVTGLRVPTTMDRPAPHGEPEEAAERRLELMARILRRGALYRIMGPGASFSSPHAAEADRAILALQSGAALSAADSAVLLKLEPRVARWSEIAKPGPLERVKP